MMYGIITFNNVKTPPEIVAPSGKVMLSWPVKSFIVQPEISTIVSVFASSSHSLEFVAVPFHAISFITTSASAGLKPEKKKSEHKNYNCFFS